MRHLLAEFRKHQVHQFISGPIPVALEARDHVAKVFLEPLFGAENQFTNTRVQAVGSYDQVKIPFASPLERDANSLLVLINLEDAIAKNHLDVTFNPGEDRCREVSARETEKSSSHDLRNRAGRKARHFSAGRIDNP